MYTTECLQIISPPKWSSIVTSFDDDIKVSLFFEASSDALFLLILNTVSQQIFCVTGSRETSKIGRQLSLYVDDSVSHHLS